MTWLAVGPCSGSQLHVQYMYYCNLSTAYHTDIEPIVLLLSTNYRTLVVSFNIPRPHKSVKRKKLFHLPPHTKKTLTDTIESSMCLFSLEMNGSQRSEGHRRSLTLTGGGCLTPQHAITRRNYVQRPYPAHTNFRGV